MKLKYYLRGLGIGIICTAIIMGIALSGNKRETLTDAEIIERARLLGMVMEEEAKEPAEDEEPPKVRGPLNEKKEEKQEEKQHLLRSIQRCLLHKEPEALRRQRCHFVKLLWYANVLA